MVYDLGAPVHWPNMKILDELERTLAAQRRRYLFA